MAVQRKLKFIITAGLAFLFFFTFFNVVYAGNYGAGLYGSGVYSVGEVTDVVVTPSAHDVGVVAQPSRPTSVSAILPPTPSTVASSYPRDLYLGITGSDVKTLQIFLNAKGFQVAQTGPGSPGKETTLFGPATKSALVRFQKAWGITATGYLGPITKSFITSAVANPVTTTPSVSVTAGKFTTVMQVGMNGSNVSELQKVLSTFPDIYPQGLITGYFGTLTEQAVKKFQIKYNITTETDPAYGIVGPKTRAKLNALLAQ